MNTYLVRVTFHTFHVIYDYVQADDPIAARKICDTFLKWYNFGAPKAIAFEIIGQTNYPFDIKHEV